MSVDVSVRLDDRLAERLRVRARAAGETLSDRLRRYADGPTGRPAGLISGPDVWEVAMWLDDLGPVDDPVAELASDDFTRIAAEQSVAGGRHHGLVVALAARFPGDRKESRH